MNLILGDVQETRMISDINGTNPSFSSNDDDIVSGSDLNSETKNVTTQVRQRGMLYVRGDAIILVAPPFLSSS